MTTPGNITSTIRYVGVDDTDLRKFENQYPTPHGMAYNSYIVFGESKTVLMDTVERAFADEWFGRVDDALEGKTPDLLVVHHMEPDHSAAIARALAKWPRMTLVASARAIDMLPQFFEDFDFTGRTLAVKEGDTLDLGGRTLRFFAAPMIHWPEVMVSYDSADKVLFSADAFGKFGAVAFDEEWLGEARRYYVNIVGKYGNQTRALLRKVAPLDIKAIASLHGPLLTGDMSEYLGAYNLWSGCEAESNGLLVAYASIYGGTRGCALEFARMASEAGIAEVLPLDLCSVDVCEAVSQAYRLGALVVAAPTYDATVFPPMARFLHHLKLKNFRNRPVGVIENGSWAPVAGKVMKDALAAMAGITVVDPMVTIRSTMHTADKAVMRELAAAMAAALAGTPESRT